MVRFRAYFDIPTNCCKKHFKGSSPKLTDKLVEEMKGAKKVSISFFYSITHHLYTSLKAT